MGRFRSGMIYHEGTLSEYNTWHDSVKTTLGISGSGIVGLRDGLLDSTRQKTTGFSDPVAHPTTSDYYYWICDGHSDTVNFTEKTLTEISALGFDTDGGEI